MNDTLDKICATVGATAFAVLIVTFFIGVTLDPYAQTAPPIVAYGTLPALTVTVLAALVYVVRRIVKGDWS